MAANSPQTQPFLVTPPSTTPRFAAAPSSLSQRRRRRRLSSRQRRRLLSYRRRRPSGSTLIVYSEIAAAARVLPLSYRPFHAPSLLCPVDGDDVVDRPPGNDGECSPIVGVVPRFPPPPKSLPLPPVLSTRGNDPLRPDARQGDARAGNTDSRMIAEDRHPLTLAFHDLVCRDLPSSVRLRYSQRLDIEGKKTLSLWEGR